MYILFLFSWMARFIYLKPREDHLDDFFEFYIKCNSTLADENTLYNVDCRYDEDFLSDAPFRRTEDATMPCSKVLGEETGALAGVSEISKFFRTF